MPRRLCTDDFTGRLPNNTNLGAKGTIAIRAFAELCRALQGREATPLPGCAAGAAERYETIADKYAATWMQYAYNATPQPHYKLSFNTVHGVDDSWSLKYNLLWQKILGFKDAKTGQLAPFPSRVFATEVAYYKTKANAFGIPLDPRHNYVKTDCACRTRAVEPSFSSFSSPSHQLRSRRLSSRGAGLSWAACMSGSADDFAEMFGPIFKFANSTPDRHPFTDLYDTVTGKQSMGGFIARPVIGGIFAKILIDGRGRAE